VDTSGSNIVVQNLATGVIKKTGANATVATLGAPVDNDGVVRSDGGTLDLTAGTGAANSSTGEYTAGLGKTVRFGGGDHLIAAGGKITGPGNVTVSAGSISGPWTVKSGAKVNFTAGDVKGPGVGLGTTALIESGATLNVIGGSFKQFVGAIHNDGLVDQ